MWLFYLALEPYVSRLWPDALISWSRLLAGRFRDPRVGRDILVGGVAGIFFITVKSLDPLIRASFGWPAPSPFRTATSVLEGARHAATLLVHSQVVGLNYAVVLLLLILLLRVVLRRQWAAVAVVLALLTVGASAASSNPLEWVLNFLIMAALVFVTIRFGLLATFFCLWFDFYCHYLPPTTELSDWYAGPALLLLMVAVAVAVYGFWTSVAGRVLFRNTVLPD